MVFVMVWKWVCASERTRTRERKRDHNLSTASDTFTCMSVVKHLERPDAFDVAA